MLISLSIIFVVGDFSQQLIRLLIQFNSSKKPLKPEFVRMCFIYVALTYV